MSVNVLLFLVFLYSIRLCHDDMFTDHIIFQEIYEINVVCCGENKLEEINHLMYRGNLENARRIKIEFEELCEILVIRILQTSRTCMRLIRH
jgi:hypothetical protein